MKKTVTYLLVVIAGLIGLVAMFPEQVTDGLIDAERSWSGLSYRTVRVENETWHYLEGGPQGADVVLLVHGFGGDKDNWTRFSRYLSDRYRVIAPDLPGFGESVPHPDWDYSLPEQIRRVNDFVDALDLERFHVAGNSMGGHLVALYALEYPARVLSTGLFNNGGIEAPNDSDVRRAWANGENPLIVESEADFDRLIDLAAHKKPFIPWPAKSVMARRAIDHAKSNQQVFESLVTDGYVPLEPVLGGLKTPVLILWGEYDRVLDVSSVDVMRPLLPQAEIVIMQDTGHLPMVERPAESAAHYLEFVARH